MREQFEDAMLAKLRAAGYVGEMPWRYITTAGRAGPDALTQTREIQQIIGAALLAIIDQYPHFVILRRRILFFRVTITAKDVRSFIEWAFRMRPDVPILYDDQERAPT